MYPTVQDIQTLLETLDIGFVNRHARQSSKTTIALEIATHAALFKDSTRIEIYRCALDCVDSSLRDKILENLRMSNNGALIKTYSKSKIEFTNNSIIEICSHNSTEKLRGKRIDMIIIDDIELMNQHNYQELISYLTPLGKLLIIGNVPESIITQIKNLYGISKYFITE